MPRSALHICLLSSLTISAAAQGYATDFETFTASAAGTAVTGQDGFYIPVAGSLDCKIYTYAGNVLNVPANPNGGNNFYAGVSQLTNVFARGQRAVTLPANGRVYIQFDILCNYTGTGTPANNIGSFSLQPSATNQYVNLVARWPTGVTFPPATWNADVIVGPTATGTTTVLPDPAFQNLAVGVWHSWGCTIDLTTGNHVEFRITNGVTNVTTTYVPPTPLALPNQFLATPTDFRFFAGGSDNLFAVDNFTITYGASYNTFGAGCAGSMGVPTLAAAPGSLPRLGNTLQVDLGNLPLGLGVMATGFSNTLAFGSVPLPYSLASSGFPGCDLLVDPMAVQFLIGVGNTVTWSFTVPNNTAFAGIELFNQGISLDNTPAGASFSNGGRCVLGL